jgi:hypothetical protein
MLKQFTWQDFLLTAMVLSLIWYVVVGLFFYREEVSGLFGGGDGLGSLSDVERPVPGRWGGSEEGLGHGGDNLGAGAATAPPDLGAGLMGRPKLPEGMSAVGASQVSFVGAGDAAADKVMQVGLVADVVQEIKEVFALLAKEDGSKSDFFLLAEGIRDSYPGIGSFPSLSKINAFIREHAPFYISEEELENLWD